MRSTSAFAWAYWPSDSMVMICRVSAVTASAIFGRGALLDSQRRHVRVDLGRHEAADHRLQLGKSGHGVGFL